MINKGLKKYFVNPSLGLTPLIIYIIEYCLTNDIAFALLVSIFYSILVDIVLNIATKTKLCGFMFRLSLTSLILTMVAWAILRNTFISDLFYIVLPEVLFVFVLALARLSKTYIISFLETKKDVAQKTYFSEFFDIARLTQYSLTIHLFLLFLYRLSHVNYEYNDFLTQFTNFILPVILLLCIIIYQEIKTKNTVKQLRMEEWLPIVTETGQVTGRIARSESRTLQNKYMHPVIRIALICEDRIYLQQRETSSSFDPGKYDHPFEQYLLFNHDLETSVKHIIDSKFGPDSNLTFNFLTKYFYENNTTKRLIFLYVIRINNEIQLSLIKGLKGKFWTAKHIDESFVEEDLFCECFQLEYEYIKNTVLLSDVMIKKAKYSH